jgi:hypothetical protein
MFNAAGGSNTPRIGEGYYHVPLCGALAHKFFGLLAKAKDTFVKNKNQKNHQIINLHLLNDRGQG